MSLSTLEDQILSRLSAMDASFPIVVFWTLAILENVGASAVFSSLVLEPLETNKEEHAMCSSLLLCFSSFY